MPWDNVLVTIKLSNSFRPVARRCTGAELPIRLIYDHRAIMALDDLFNILLSERLVRRGIVRGAQDDDLCPLGEQCVRIQPEPFLKVHGDKIAAIDLDEEPV